MIEITNNFRSLYRSAIRKARSERIRCVKLEEGLWYVARRAKGHGRHFVRFIEDETGRVIAECRYVDGFRCKGTFQGRCCTHIALAFERSIQEGRKKLMAA